MRTTALSDTFGVQVHGIHPLGQVDEGTAAELRSLLYRSQLLLFRGLSLSPADQVRVAALFGIVTPPWDDTHLDESDSCVELFRESPQRPYRRPAEHWHTDGSFLATPTDATFLHAIVVPDEGGQTRYLNARAAFRSLPEPVRGEVERGHAVHSFRRQFGNLRQRSGRIDAGTAVVERDRFPDVEHPLARPHPVTGEPALYLNDLCLDRVVGYDADRGADLLRMLWSHVNRPQFRYEHEWLPGDLLVWDNPSLLHQATPVPAGQRRLVQRTTAQYHRTAE
jgi:alpha-ketoglutarate-dependent taurine dioxygenase